MGTIVHLFQARGRGLSAVRFAKRLVESKLLEARAQSGSGIMYSQYISESLANPRQQLFSLTLFLRRRRIPTSAKSKYCTLPRKLWVIKNARSI